MAQEALLDHVPVPVGNVHRMHGEMAVPQQAAQAYTAEVQTVFGKHALPRFDLLLLGLGEEGHTASIFPGVNVPTDPNIPVAAVFVPKVNTWRLTLTLPVLNAAAHLLFLVAGAAKQEALRAVIQGPRSLDLPGPARRPQQWHTDLPGRPGRRGVPAVGPSLVWSMLTLPEWASSAAGG